MKKSALDLLQDSHTLLCQRVVEILENPESTIQELKLAADWLHKNGIEALPVKGSPMGDVVNAASNRNDNRNNPNIIQLPSFESEEEDDVEEASLRLG